MNMKKYITGAVALALLSIANTAVAQVAIGKETVTNSSVLLEFSNEAKGIILPAVNSAPGAADGTFILDNTVKAVRVRQNGGWTNLSTEGNAAVNPFVNAGNDIITGNSSVIIGASTSTKPGILVLESTTKALVLPKVAEPSTSMPSPVSGTMVYDTQASMIAVFDGSQWSYWK